MTDIQTKLDYADAIADWFLELAEGHSVDGEFEEALKCTFVAAAILYKHNRKLSSSRIESNLLFVADGLQKRSDLTLAHAHKKTPEKSCLHVMNEAIPAGGHMAMAKRWMGN